MTDLDTLIVDLELLGCTVEPCGSRVTCNPPPTDTDQDYLVEVPAHDRGHVALVVSDLTQAGFHLEGNGHYQDQAAEGFMSWRRGDVNLIVTANPLFASRHRVATKLCTRLNLQIKNNRIAVFQAVLYGKEWEAA